MTVVESAVNCNCSDVSAESSELSFLNLAHLTVRIKHIYVHAWHSEESVGHSTAGIARSGNEHIHFFLSVVERVEMAEHTGHEARTHILECQSRAVEEFETILVVAHVHQRYREVEGIVNDVLQHSRIDIVIEKSVCHHKRYLLQRHVGNILEECLRQCRNTLRHIKAFIGS